MPADWTKWDRTAAILGGLEYRCSEVRRNLGEMSLLLDAMKERPCFETKAEDALNTLEAETNAILATVHQLQSQYQKIAAAA